MKRRKFIEWCGAALAALVVPWRKAVAAEPAASLAEYDAFWSTQRYPTVAATITTHMDQESIDKINAFMAEARANGGFKPLVLQDAYDEGYALKLDDVIHHSVDKPPQSLGPHYLKRYSGKEIGVYNPGSKTHGRWIVIDDPITDELPPEVLKKSVDEWAASTERAQSMRTVEEMEASIPLCKNCGGHFTRDHTHIFHGEDVCDKYMDPLTGRWSRYSIYEAAR